MENKLDLIKLLDYIDPSNLDYQEWINIGMALKHEGYTAMDWDSWSQNDTRYKSGECFIKWESFQGTSSPVTGATITQMAKDQGWKPFDESNSRELGWDDTLTKDELVVVDRNWIEGKEIHEPMNWNPVQELIKYLSILFEASENVGYVTDTWQNEDGKHLPTKGAYDRTAGELIQALSQCEGDMGAVIGDYNHEAGAWIRFNPFDGKGVKNDNVTEYRYALVESDNTSVEKQNAILRELELPIAAMVYSGSKSVHAIVKVEAGNYEEYRKRVNYLYDVCKKNGLAIDSQNRNPSRLSRMPGIERNGKKQFLIETNIGKENWTEWREWIESINDDLPEPEGLEEFWNDMPPLAPVLIDGVLRQGHKMLMAGPSKAGKSFALIELCIAIAEGREWLGWGCTKGRVLYVNLELDRASCLHRFKDVYTALGWQPHNLKNIDIWNLRGKTAPMDKLTPKLIRRAAKKGYIAIVIDPIYKVLTGDENSADQMAHFTGQFDKICTELGAATIYCHHHSKGSQGGKKSMDRASGSGVFARDPDALIDLVELELNEDIYKAQENKAVCREIEKALQTYNPQYLHDEVSQDDLCSNVQMENHLVGKVPAAYKEKVANDIAQAKKSIRNMTAWRVEGTLREFPKFAPVNMWFNYPIHRVDDSGVLKDIELEDAIDGRQKGMKKIQESNKAKAEASQKELEDAIELANFGEPPTVQMVAETLDVGTRAIQNRIKKSKKFYIDKNDNLIKTKANSAKI